MSVTTSLLAREHRQELLASGISDALIDHLVAAGHLYTLEGDRDIDAFLNRNARARWKHGQADRAWVFRGLDPHTGELMGWGCLKPDSPRVDPRTGKTIKYEHPLSESQRVFIVPNLEGRAPAAPYILAEGFKKTASIVSAGYRAIGLSGIWGGVRKNSTGGHDLAPDLIPYAVPGQEFVIFFDYETKLKTKRAVELATIALGKVLISKGCTVRVVQLPGPEKGADDFKVARGQAALDAVIKEAIAFQDFLDTVWDAAIPDLSLEPALEVEQRYLDVTLPESGLVVIRSPMGSGKTELLRRELGRCPSILSLTHRITLGRQAANRLGLALYSDTNIQRVPRLEITVDSLYKLPTYQNRYHTIVLDEVEQILSHMLDSSTCKVQRVNILQRFAYFLQSAERVIIQQAEISDAAVNYIAQLRGGETPHVIVNDHASEPRIVGWYNQHEPSRLIRDLTDSIESGERPLIACYSKKRAKRLEKTFTRKYPDKRIRVVHGDNSSDPETIDFIETINESVQDLDILIFTPSMSTGVSIDAQSFSSVWGIFDTAECHASELLQMMGRYRPSCSWYVWSANRGAGYIGKVDPAELQGQELERNRRTGILTEIDPTTGTEGGPHLECWAQLKARCNSSRLRQRDVLRKLLAREGHYLFEMEGPTDDAIKSELETAKILLEQEESEAIASAPDLTEAEAEILEFRSDRLTQTDRQALEKRRLRQGYQTEVTPDLVLKDKEGRLLRAIIALEELLNPETALERDLKDIEKYKFLPDRRHRTLKRAYREKLGLKEFLNLDREWSQSDLDDLTDLVEDCREDIKGVLNLTIPEKFSPCWVVSQLLQQVGVKVLSRREGGRGEQVRYYRVDPENWEFVSQTIERRQQSRVKKRASEISEGDRGSQPSLYMSNVIEADYGQTSLDV